MTKISIITLDDHQLFLDGLNSIFKEQENIIVLKSSTSPKEILNFLEYTTPDLIISDISMPDMNGIEFIKIVKRLYPSIKIIVVSMFEKMHSQENIDGYLLKESSKDRILEVVYGTVLENKTYFDFLESQAENYNFKDQILSPREKDIIRLISEEYTSTEIAEKLFISRYTIDSHRKNIFIKLGVKNIAGMVKKALHLGIIK